MKTLTIEKQNQLGKEIAEILCLRKKKDGRYNTTWGDKTPIGLFNTVARIVETINEKGEV